MLSTENSMQRLSVDGHFENRQALANVWIDHKGECVLSKGWRRTDEQRQAHRSALAAASPRIRGSGTARTPRSS